MLSKVPRVGGGVGHKIILVENFWSKVSILNMALGGPAWLTRFHRLPLLGATASLHSSEHSLTMPRPFPLQALSLLSLSLGHSLG